MCVTDNIPRLLISGNPSLKAFASSIAQIQETDPVRVMHVDLDYVMTPIRLSRPKHQYADPAGLRHENQPCFPAGIFRSSATARLTRSTSPTVGCPCVPISLTLSPANANPRGRKSLRVDAGSLVRSLPCTAACAASGSANGPVRVATEPYTRLSPWDPQVRQQVTEIYEDLARYASFNGILFHDDAVLTDQDDAGQQTTRQKSQTLIGFTHALSGGEAYPRSADKTARNMFALPILDPASEAWFAQNLDDFGGV